MLSSSLIVAVGSVVLSAAAAVAVTPLDAKPRSLVIDGSSAVSPFVKMVTGAFARDHKIGISVEQHGSTEGITCLKEAKCQLGMVTALPTAQDGDLIVNQLGWDGVAVVTSLDVVGVDSLTSKQILDIYTGKDTNWSELGGPNLQIKAFQSDTKRSVRGMFDQFFKVTSSVPELGSTEQISNFLKVSKGTITYLSLGVARMSSKTMKIIKIDGIEPSEANVRSNKYRLKRGMYLVRLKDSAVDAVLEELVQAILDARKEHFEKLGYLEN
jgi:phosphate transport system substrate-binding protein